jgi:tetratricopeptide (TPR) repeat protein
MSLSLAIITKDCGPELDRCLSSCESAFDEIIIVNTGTNPDDIALKHNAKCFKFPWINDFSAARNYAMSLCTTSHYMWLDDDDILEPIELEKLKTYKYQDQDIVMMQYNYSQDEYGNSSCMLERERIIRLSLGLKWEGKIHEVIGIAGRTYNSTTIVIKHFRNHASSARNLQILEDIVKTEPTPRNLLYLGNEYFGIGRIQEAVDVYEKYLFSNNNDWYENIYCSFQYLAQGYLILGNEAKFLENIFRSITIEPRRSEPYCYLGDYFFNNKKDWTKAVFWYEQAINVKRATELLAVYQPQYSTYLPAMQLTIALNNLGKCKEALKYNELYLKYKPLDQTALNNKKQLEEFLRNRDGQGKKLHLGCGSKILESYWNVDIFQGKGVDEVFELDSIPYKDNSISEIYSEHALEHVILDRAGKAIIDWYRVLQPGGKLTLRIPDFQQCCENYIKSEPTSYDRLWYKWTIYGIQKSQAGEPDDAQIHKSGFSKSEIEIVLKRAGFEIEKSFNYDGFRTPSVEIQCKKPGKVSKICWISQNNEEAAQTRIRVKNVNKWLDSHGVKSDIKESYSPDYDIYIVGKSFSENDFNEIKKLKENGKIVYCDLCEELSQFPWVNEILKLVDKVICCSYRLEEKVKKINPSTEVIEDAFEQ